MTTRKITTLMLVGAVIGLVVASIFIGLLALIDIDLSSSVVGAVAGSVAGAVSVVITERMRSA